MVAVVKVRKGKTIAGIWSEGKGFGDDSGTRQYSMLLDIPTYGGPRKLTPHISAEGGVTYRADGSKFPWCADYAAGATTLPVDEWMTLGFTYDGQFIRAFFNGVLDAQKLDPVKHKRTDPYFTKEGPKGGSRGLNPYFHGLGIFRYDAEKHARTKIEPSDFTVGSRLVTGSKLHEALVGEMGAAAACAWRGNDFHRHPSRRTSSACRLQPRRSDGSHAVHGQAGPQRRPSNRRWSCFTYSPPTQPCAMTSAAGMGDWA